MVSQSTMLLNKFAGEMLVSTKIKSFKYVHCMIDRPKSMYKGLKITTGVSVLLKIWNLISFQSLNLGGHRGTTDDVATVPFHHSLSSAALRESPILFRSIP